MSANNNVLLIGRWTKDPIVQKTTNGISRMTCCIAVQKTKDEAYFLNVVAWREVADNTWKYTKKGSMVAVSGELVSRNYEKDGQKKTAYEVNAHDIRYLDSKTEPQVIENIPELTASDLPF